MPGPLRVAVIGAGAFGRNHLRVFHDLSQYAEATTPVQLAAVVDANPTTRAEASARYAIPAYASTEDLLAADLGLHAATVSVPTIAHAPIAEQLLSAGLDILVEKPLTATLAEADHLIALANRLGRIFAAGHLERFNPAVTAAQARLTRPMFFEAHRLSIFTPRSLDVDVVLDLMIHDLDILLTFAQSAVTEVRAVGLPVLSPKVDIANVRLEFASGAVANLTASRISTEQIRKLRLFQPAQYLSLDYARQELLTINVDPAAAAAAAAAGGTALRSHLPTDLSSRPESRSDVAERPASAPAHAQPQPPHTEAAPRATQPHPSAGLSFTKLDPPRAEPLRLELEDFLHAVATRQPPRVSAQAARAALAVALEINATIAAHAQATGLAPGPVLRNSDE